MFELVYLISSNYTLLDWFIHKVYKIYSINCNGAIYASIYATVGKPMQKIGLYCLNWMKAYQIESKFDCISFHNYSEII